MTTLETLERTLRERLGASAESSYVASLYARGLDRILQKVGEEAVETVIAGKSAGAARSDAEQEASRSALIAETADLWFHCMVMLVHMGLSHRDVLEELERRAGTSGHVEKARRNN